MNRAASRAPSRWLASVVTSLLGAALGLGCTDGKAGPEASAGQAHAFVYAGEPDTDDTNVVAVENFAGGQCTGSLISPELVMTARHCVAETNDKQLDVVCGQTPFKAPDSAGAIFVISKPQVTEDPNDYLPVAEIRMPANLGDDLCGTDVVLLRLATPLTSITPLVPRLDPPVTPNERYSSVGYGVDESLSDMPSGVRKRRDGFQVGCDGPDCGAAAQVRDNEWVGTGGPCHGDSGGPALDEAGQVIGVVSRGKSGCEEPVFSDVASRADWLEAEAVRAAGLAKDAAPAWAGGPVPTPCDADPCGAAGAAGASNTNDAAASAPPASTCAFHPAGARSTPGALLAALLGFGSAAWRRRRRTR